MQISYLRGQVCSRAENIAIPLIKPNVTGIFCERLEIIFDEKYISRLMKDSAEETILWKVIHYQSLLAKPHEGTQCGGYIHLCVL